MHSKLKFLLEMRSVRACLPAIAIAKRANNRFEKFTHCSDLQLIQKIWGFIVECSGGGYKKHP
jgi:hypothetical protein